MGQLDNCITSLASRNAIFLNAVGFFSAVLTCFAWQSFRQGFTSAEFEGVQIFSYSYKPMIVTFQLVGYAISKFYGIKFCSELKANRRWFWMIILHSASLFFLILFGLIPPPYNAFFIFFNGLSLGQSFGLMFSYVEGRTTTHLLLSGWNLTSMFSQGACRSIGSVMIQKGLSEFWTPAVIGTIVYFPMLFGTFLFESLPPPTEEDITQRTKRVPMNGAERSKFLKGFAPGIICFTVYYVTMQVLSDFRSFFSLEIFKDFG
jgi:hypothetical protein